MPWRQHVLKLAKMRKGIIPGDIYAFGIYSGDSLMSICNYLVDNKIKVCNIFGFDVFRGMPHEPNEPCFQEAWKPGNFNGVDLWKMEPQEICNHLEKKVKDLFILNNQECPNVKIFPGLVEDTLIDSNMDQYNLKQCAYIDVDFDIYTPSKYALEYLFNKGLIKKNTIIGYDDWGGTPHLNYEAGESRAHKEVFLDRNIDVELLFQSQSEREWCIQTNPHIQRAYVIKGNI